MPSTSRKGSQVSTGAKLELRIGSVIVAYATNVQYNWNYDVQAIKGIDDITVKEHAETGAIVSFSASMFRVAHKAAIKNGWMPKLNKLLQQPELTAVIRDNIANSVLLTITGLKCTGRSGSVDARGAWTETLNFVGREFIDEEG